ncbi:hypothetical protein ACFWB2_14740 [Streptomyces virginiae]|uniref:hypothetical protein n=1 Tax=Streptomyces TaxID=1883 RepID=UPI00093BB37E|nr:hypothetical protein [Streptomyces sp. MJM1172]OKI67573.1 hypothetical protein AMK15_06295 [Streptomyces sp. MJM1172]
MVPELFRALAAAEEAGGGPDIAKLVGSFIQYGIVGLVVVLLILGVIAPKYVLDAITKEKENWRDAFEKERAAHQVTREQLAKAEERGDVATEQGRLLNTLLMELGHRPDPAHRSA